MKLNYKQPSASVHQFAMVPRADIPRSSFKMQKTVKKTFDSGYLIPIFCEEVLPGDSFNVRMTSFVRLATPLFPFMDNLHIDSFFFFVPNRLVWQNWKRFMGEQDSPGASISYVIPQCVSPAGGYPINSIFDHFGLPTVGQVGGGATVTHSVLPLRGYNLIFNEWFRDENLTTPSTVSLGDGPDLQTLFGLRRRLKRHDYFTSALPFTQKGSPVALPLAGQATVRTAASALVTGAQNPLGLLNSAGGGVPTGAAFGSQAGTGVGNPMGNTAASSPSGPFTTGTVYPSNLYADLSTATATTINALRLAFQTQKLLERDARGGTRYTEIVRSHFGVMSPDARLQRPEYLGGGSSPVNVAAIAQTSSTDATSPQGSLSGVGTSLMTGHGFSQSFTEHGYIIGLSSVRADLTYQQGMRRHWSRNTRYDFYFPAFAMLGEQAILNKEIYCDGSANDNLVFGYQERWAEYRYNPNEIHGLFRSTAANTIDPWHLAQRFNSLPTLGATFIDEAPPVQRVIAVGSEAAGQEFLADMFFDCTVARPLPMYSVPGLVDHF